MIRIKAKLTTTLIAAAVAMGSLVTPLVANAVNSPITQVQTVLVDSVTDQFFVVIRDDIPNQPACATNSKRMTLKNNTRSAKLQLATLLTALNSGKRVRLYGTGRCEGSTQVMRMVMIYR